ncbi:MAG: NUDIX hydrolase [Clostridia bacterium]
MKETTLCYIEKDGKYLMLLRNKKPHDVNEGKWIGIGGKIEKGETARDCIIREVKEETGFTLNSVIFRGVVHFKSEFYPDEDMYLFSSDNFSGILKECDEGELKWIDKDKIFNLNLWEGDKIFLKALGENDKVFSLTLHYGKDNLISYELTYKD